jgi:hypothetical protein
MSSILPPIPPSILFCGRLGRKTVDKIKNKTHNADRPDAIVFLQVAVSTSGSVYDDFTRLLFLHAHREASILAGELPGI